MQRMYHLRDAVKNAEVVLICPRIGCIESYIKVSKKEILDLFSKYDADTSLTEIDARFEIKNGEMYID